MTDMHMRVMEAVNRVVPAELVGGAVRDLIMGASPKDYDFATYLLPDEVERRVRQAERKPFTIGKQYGTIGFKCELDDGTYEYVEVTTYRQDASGRKPEVAFVDNITHDLSRRDFTMNAIAMRPNGKLIDPFGGAEDIEQDILKCVGNPTTRFKEDPLRMLRAARFVATKGMFIEPKTYKSMKDHAHRVLEVSKERWTQEMDKLLMGDWAAEGLEVMWETGLMAYILPELAPQYKMDQLSRYHGLHLHEHTKEVVRVINHTDVTYEWAALLHDVGKPAAQTFKRDGSANYIKHDLIGAEIVDGVALRLKWSKDRRNNVRSLVLHHMDEDSPLRQADLMSRGEVEPWE